MLFPSDQGFVVLSISTAPKELNSRGRFVCVYVCHWNMLFPFGQGFVVLSITPKELNFSSR